MNAGDRSVSISVLTPSFNYRRYLGECVASMDRATCRGVQHIIVDDASSDDSGPLLRSLPPRRSREVFLEGRNRGLAATLNVALERAAGEWVGWLNADDFYLPWTFREVAPRLTDDVDVVYGDAVFVDAHSRFVRLLPQHGFSRWVLGWYGTFLIPSAAFIRADLLKGIGGWDPRLTLLVDWDLWLRLHTAGARFGYASVPLGAFRRHGGQLSQQRDPAYTVEKDLVRRRHGLATHPAAKRLSRALGRSVHGAWKVQSGSYMRQLRAARMLRGAQLSPSQEDGPSRLAEIYGLRR